MLKTTLMLVSRVHRLWQGLDETTYDMLSSAQHSNSTCLRLTLYCQTQSNPYTSHMLPCQGRGSQFDHSKTATATTVAASTANSPEGLLEAPAADVALAVLLLTAGVLSLPCNMLLLLSMLLLLPDSPTALPRLA